ncbi:hypothetical protein AMTR_s00145p00100270 [Amborella trichopoda]|uniref:Uncharacterized protein n=1 Tax=Amborella trichopoda TaxID=13333 RepID=W1PEB2_AMBTC|nr:hypothetical protein AMTR_s00145p00100270 [Amborella trichopoda]
MKGKLAEPTVMPLPWFQEQTNRRLEREWVLSKYVVREGKATRPYPSQTVGKTCLPLISTLELHKKVYENSFEDKRRSFKEIG